MRGKSLQLRGEDESAAIPLVVQRLDAQMVARDEQALRRAVPQGEGEHALEMLEHAHAVFAIGVEQRFRVAGGTESMAALGELLAQGEEVVDLPVEDDGELTIGRAHRLRAAGKVED